MSFLKAEWRKLALANYIIDEKILTKYLPAGTELDFWNGNCYVSLVGFMFLNTKLLGIKIPFHTNWKVYKVHDFDINVDFGIVYGKEFEFLNTLNPNSVMLAEGSEITVENKRTIKINHKA